MLKLSFSISANRLAVIKPTGFEFNKFHVPPTDYSYVFCTELRTKVNHFPTQQSTVFC